MARLLVHSFDRLVWILAWKGRFGGVIDFFPTNRCVQLTAVRTRCGCAARGAFFFFFFFSCFSQSSFFGFPVCLSVPCFLGFDRSYQLSATVKISQRLRLTYRYCFWKTRSCVKLSQTHTRNTNTHILYIHTHTHTQETR